MEITGLKFVRAEGVHKENCSNLQKASLGYSVEFYQHMRNLVLEVIVPSAHTGSEIVPTQNSQAGNTHGSSATGQSRGKHIFSVKSHTVNILNFSAHDSCCYYSVLFW